MAFESSDEMMAFYEGYHNASVQAGVLLEQAKVHKRFLSILPLLAVSACAGNTQTAQGPEARNIPGHITHTPDGSYGYVVTCGGFGGMSDCVKNAGEICLEQGYRTVETNDDAPMWTASPILMAIQNNRGMTIRCNTKDGLYPLDDTPEAIAKDS
jgi:hypothetical protein